MISSILVRATLVVLPFILALSITSTSHAGSAPPIHAGVKFRECSADCPLMVVVPAGQFSMETDRPDVEKNANAAPAHTVTFERPFAIGVNDITRGEFTRFVRATGFRTEGGCQVVDPEARWIVDLSKDWRNPGFKQTNRDPVVCISWNDAQSYISWLNRRAGSKNPSHGPYRLPSEAEWEYAARAGSTVSYYWGARPDHDLANYGIDDCYPCGAKREGRDRWYFTSPVGSFPPNAFGLYDASGNVWQWTQDCAHNSLKGGPSDGSAWMTDIDQACYNRILRGGSWLDPGFLLVVSLRNPWAPDVRNYANGFRIARTLGVEVK